MLQLCNKVSLNNLCNFSASWLVGFLLKNSKKWLVQKCKSFLVTEKQRCRYVNCLLSSVLSPTPYLPVRPGFSLRQQFFAAEATFCCRSLQTPYSGLWRATSACSCVCGTEIFTDAVPDKPVKCMISSNKHILHRARSCHPVSPYCHASKIKQCAVLA